MTREPIASDSADVRRHDPFAVESRIARVPFASRGSENTLVRSPNGWFVVMISDPRSLRSPMTWKTSSAAPSGEAR
jgi:hypothetical protein